VAQLLLNGLITPGQAEQLGQQVGQRAGEQAASQQLIAVRSKTAEGGSGEFDWLAFMAPSMAILFLMFTTTSGGRTILTERRAGTLPRLLVSPTRASQVLAGKVVGVYSTGLAQMAILIGASALLFGVRWGDPVAVLLITLALVAAATAWGILIAAYARSPAQANAIGTAMALVFGAAAGNFLPRQVMPDWLQSLSRISPNAWGLEAFEALSRGGTLFDIVLPIIALWLMATVLFGASVVAFRRQYS
jgi:ABC-2 type transport system permease protein